MSQLVGRCSRRLKQEKMAYGTAISLLLDAGAAVQRQDRAAAMRMLAAAQEIAVAEDLASSRRVPRAGGVSSWEETRAVRSARTPEPS